MTQVVPYPATPEPDDDQPRALPAGGAARGWLVKHGSLPSPRQVRTNAGWWLTDGAKHAAALFLKAPLLLLLELRPISIGLGRVLSRWARWCAVAEYAEAAAKADGNDRVKHQKEVEQRRSGRRRLSFAVVVVLTGVIWWAVYAYPAYLLVAGLVLVGVFDAVGRMGTEKAEKAPQMPSSPLHEGKPLGSLRAELQQQLEFEGFVAEDLVIDMPLPVRNGWRVNYHSRQAIDDVHLRALERALQIRRNGITQIREKENAARGELWIALEDPLADLIPSPELPALSIYDMLPLGKNANGGVWAELFLRTHFILIGASQSGKSSLFWQIIYVLRLCSEVELDGIDLTDGPCFSACRRAFRRRATDEAGAAAILNEGIALIKKRAAELSRLAEDDATPDEFEEKHRPSAQFPQRVILVDEGARVTENKDLLPLVEYILRYGAKTAVTLGLAGQGGGLGDFGSSIVRAMAMLKIMLACSRQDVLSVFGKDARDEGYRPDLLEPAQGSEVRDAGKAFVQSAVSQSVEMRRAYRLEQADVRRRDRELGTRETHREVDVIEAQEIPTILADVEQAFTDAGDPDRLPTADLLAWMNDNGYELDAKKLADQLRPFELRPTARWRPAPGVDSIRGYYLSELREALGKIDG